MTDYEKLIERLEGRSEELSSVRALASLGGDGLAINVAEPAALITDLSEAADALQAEREARQRTKAELDNQIDFSIELQRLLWALAEGNTLPKSAKGYHAYTVASRAKVRAEAAEAKLERAMEALKRLASSKAFVVPHCYTAEEIARMVTVKTVQRIWQIMNQHGVWGGYTSVRDQKEAIRAALSQRETKEGE